MEITNREIDFVKWNKTHFFLPADDVTPCKNRGYLLVCSMHYYKKLVFRRGPTCINQPCFDAVISQSGFFPLSKVLLMSMGRWWEWELLSERLISLVVKNRNHLRITWFCATPICIQYPTFFRVLTFNKTLTLIVKRHVINRIIQTLCNSTLPLRFDLAQTV